jgi:pyruvate/2-oxoglutarate dehydrogenase complex dihydrolipoamide acyltransferase (E2) component
MATEIRIPADLWDGESEAVITVWLVSDGAAVKEGQLLAEIMVEKVQYEIRSPGDGVVAIAKEADDIVRKGTILGTVG